MVTAIVQIGNQGLYGGGFQMRPVAAVFVRYPLFRDVGNPIYLFLVQMLALMVDFLYAVAIRVFNVEFDLQA